MYISSNEFKNGITIEVDKELYTIIEFLHVKPGKGAAFVRTKLKNLKTGAVIEKTFKAGEKVNQAIIEHRPMQYIYNTGTDYVFMDKESYDQVSIPAELLGENINFLKDGIEVIALYHEGTCVGVDFPFFVELEVTKTEPGLKGDTVSGALKPATLETGAVIQVPLFIKEGDIVQIDTRTGKYLKRV